MKSLKKTLVLLVVLSMIFSTLVPAFAATDVADLDCEDAVLRMEALEIIKGYDDGTFKPENTITRAEMAVIICKMTGITEAAANDSKNVASKFSDVKAGEWYTGWINLAAGNGIIAGFPDGTFRPNDVLTLNQVLTLCVKALGRGGYVDQMGTWPANYVTEAARLNLLKDVKGASSANRGNVAVICWNTLNAATWYVNSENLNGEIQLSDGVNAKTLLAINFSEFATEDAGTLKEITGLGITDAYIAESETQLKVPFAEVVTDDNVAFGDDFAKEPTKNKDEKSFKDKAKDYVYIYVPEEICEDLEELVGKSITIVLGEDNVAVLVIVEEDIKGNDFVTAYEVTTAGKEKITIGGTKYTMTTDNAGYTVKLNDKTVNARAAAAEQTGATAVQNGPCEECGEATTHDAECYTGGYQPAVTAATALVNALGLAGADEADLKEIEKAIEATVILDSEDTVKSISLKTSATIEGYSIETVVEKVKESSSTYKISTKAGDISWSLDDEEDEDIEFPKVYVDGEKADIRDIQAGNVLTVYTDANSLADVEALDKIYVSTKTVAGNPARITKSENAIKVDGDYYAPSFTVVDGAEDGVDGTVVVTTEELKDGEWDEFNSKNILKNEEVTLYLNMYGEYVAISLEKVATDYTFGLVTFVAESMTTSGEEEEYQEAKIRVLLDNGSKKYFTVSLDTSDEDLMDELAPSITEVLDVLQTVEKGDFIMFEATADNKIVVEDENAIVRLVDKTGAMVPVATGVIEGDFVFGTPKAQTPPATTLDDGEFDLTYGTETLNDVEYDASETIIFNIKEKEVVAKWDAILNPAETEFLAPNNTFIIFEDVDADVAKYIVTFCNYTSSDSVYAIGGEQEVYQDEANENKFYADLVGMDDLVEYASSAKSRDVRENWVVEYAMNSTKLSDTYSIINVEALFDKDTKYDIDKVAEMVDFSDRGTPAAYELTSDGTVDGNKTYYELVGETYTEVASPQDANIATYYERTAEAVELVPETALLGLTGNEKLETIQLAEIAVKSNDDYKLKFVKNDNKNDDVANIDVDEKVRVFELSYANNVASVEEIDIEDLRDRVEEGVEDIHAIPCTVGTTNPDHVIFVFVD